VKEIQGVEWMEEMLPFQYLFEKNVVEVPHDKAVAQR
jgi:hypothetical protein